MKLSHAGEGGGPAKCIVKGRMPIIPEGHGHALILTSWQTTMHDMRGVPENPLHCPWSKGPGSDSHLVTHTVWMPATLGPTYAH